MPGKVSSDLEGSVALSVRRKPSKGLGRREIDQRTTLGKALAQWRRELVADLGGKEAVSAQQIALIELAAGTKLLLDSIDAWLLKQPSLVNARRRAVLPIVLQRQQLADSLARALMQLGAERLTKKLPAVPPISPPVSRLEQLAERLLTFEQPDFIKALDALIPRPTDESTPSPPQHTTQTGDSETTVEQRASTIAQDPAQEAALPPQQNTQTGNSEFRIQRDDAIKEALSPIQQLDKVSDWSMRATALLTRISQHAELPEFARHLAGALSAEMQIDRLLNIARDIEVPLLGSLLDYWRGGDPPRVERDSLDETTAAHLDVLLEAVLLRVRLETLTKRDRLTAAPRSAS